MPKNDVGILVTIPFLIDQFGKRAMKKAFPF